MAAAMHSSDVRAELARLRRRAYGPDADIHTDPPALARLRDLEERAAIATAGVTPAASPEPKADAPPAARGDGAPRLDRSASSRTEEALPTDVAPRSPTDGLPAPARPWWRRPAVLIAALAIALIVVAASVVPSLRGGPDRTLSQTAAAAEIPFPDEYQWLTYALGISRDALHSYRGVGEIMVWAGTSKDGVSCLLVTGTDNPFGFGCSRAGRDATADIVLDSDMASLPKTELAERTTLRFVYRGDRVDVWITEP